MVLSLYPAVVSILRDECAGGRGGPDTSGPATVNENVAAVSGNKGGCSHEATTQQPPPKVHPRGLGMRKPRTLTLES